MKRSAFLTAGAAATLAGCGATHAATGVLPHAGEQAVAHGVAGTAALPISPHTLAHPVIGEAARWDGPAAPPGWMFADGRTLEISSNPVLFSVLRTSGGGDGKTTFALPKTAQRWIVAVTGVLPSNPKELRALYAADLRPNGVSVPNISVTLPPAHAAPHPAVPHETTPLWYPGTIPTAEQVAEQQRAER
jgi:hypothetical protein